VFALPDDDGDAVVRTRTALSPISAQRRLEPATDSSSRPRPARQLGRRSRLGSNHRRRASVRTRRCHLPTDADPMRSEASPPLPPPSGTQPSSRRSNRYSSAHVVRTPRRKTIVAAAFPFTSTATGTNRRRRLSPSILSGERARIRRTASARGSYVTPPNVGAREPSPNS